MFPKVADQHKPNKPLIPTGLGVFYVLVSVVYLFFMHFLENFTQGPNNVSPPMTLAACILFGGFMGLLDDWMDLRWRYKAFFPLVAAIPLISLATSLNLRTSMTIPFLGMIEFGIAYYFIVIPIIVTVVTNTVNQLGGLNGLETVCPVIVMLGLMVISGANMNLLYGPLIVWLILTFLNFRGRIFVGNTGSFAIGITLGSFAIISDVKGSLLVSILPYVFNSVLILLTFFLYRTKASVSFDGEKLCSDHRRSLITLITFKRPLTERQVVLIISLLVALSTSASVVLQWLFP